MVSHGCSVSTTELPETSVVTFWEKKTRKSETKILATTVSSIASKVSRMIRPSTPSSTSSISRGPTRRTPRRYSTSSARRLRPRDLRDVEVRLQARDREGVAGVARQRAGRQDLHFAVAVLAPVDPDLVHSPRQNSLLTMHASLVFCCMLIKATAAFKPGMTIRAVGVEAETSACAN